MLSYFTYSKKFYSYFQALSQTVVFSLEAPVLLFALSDAWSPVLDMYMCTCKYIDRKHVTLKAIPLLLSCVVEMTALYNVKSFSTDFSASRQDKRVL